MQKWFFDEPENRIISDDVVTHITPKAAAVLRCLLHKKGKVVSKQDILADVWPGLHVTEDLVREYVFDLRTALGDDARQPRYIETVRGKGFKLAGEVSFAQEPGAPSTDLDRSTIGVLPPIVAGDDPALTLIAEALSDAIVASLANSGPIDVVSRHASFASDLPADPAATARKLGVGYLLESRMAVAGCQPHVTYFLVEGETGRHVWAQRFDVTGTDQAELQDLVHKVVHALAGWHGELHVAAFRLIARKRRGHLTAFEHFICGCDLELNFDEASVTRALDHLDQSLALDPGFARCWVMKSIMLQWSFDVFAGKDPDILKRSAEAMDRAYVLNPRDPVTLSFMALQRAREGDLAGGLEALAQAENSCGSDADASICVATALCVLQGRFKTARQFFDRAHAINHAPPGWYRFVEARLRFYFGEYAQSVAASKTGPQRVSAMIYRCLSQVMLGQIAAAVITYEDLLERYPGFDPEFYARYFPIADPKARDRYDTAVTLLRAGLDGR
ncbi:winged helix-turn-helix domain-containing tetratricopeptide repeat protein [Yoonia sp. R2-816]|uniref:winged helix-turn-helix domain-containing tetratricopeptide repeat protein n=1 Tax=Yoonia sp. R2-816 TaxID=3342638 RepID=UPI003728B90E